MLPRHWYRHSWQVGLTTATVYYMVSARTSCTFAVYRMQRQDSSLVQGNTITSLLCCVIFIITLRQRTILKITTWMHHCLNGSAPSYLATYCITVSFMFGRRQLRFAASGQRNIPRTKIMTFGPRSFKVFGPTIWNDLPTRFKDSCLSKNFQKIA